MDIIIDEKKSSYTEYEHIELFSMRLRLKCNKSNQLCGKALTLNRLCNQPFILMDENSNMNEILTKACKRAGFTPTISVLCNDIECYEKFLAAGMGIGIGREAADGLSGDVCDLNVMDFREHYTVYAYYSPKEYYGNVKDFIDFLKSKEI